MTSLKPGDDAPNFSAKDQLGDTRSLSDYSGKTLVLQFYPKDDTPGCTAEACDLRDNYHRFQAQGYEILGVSPDSAKKHIKFVEKYNLPFDLLADEAMSWRRPMASGGKRSSWAAPTTASTVRLL